MTPPREDDPDSGAFVASARDLSIDYRSSHSGSRFLAVRGVTFDLARGEILGVIGESGSGKSTLAAALAGEAQLDEDSPAICGGSLSVFGIDLRRPPRGTRERLARRVGYLREDGANDLDPRLTVAENVLEPVFVSERRVDPRAAGQAAAVLVDAVHLPLSILALRPWELSSGQRQRVALARALVQNPGLLIADEPTRGVDITVRRDVLKIIPELQADRGFAAIVISSELAVLTGVATRIVAMQDGAIVGIGALEELVASPTHPYLRSLAGAIATAEADRVARAATDHLRTDYAVTDYAAADYAATDYPGASAPMLPHEQSPNEQSPNEQSPNDQIPNEQSLNGQSPNDQIPHEGSPQ